MNDESSVIDPLRLVVLAALCGGTGTSLLLSNVRWFHRTSLSNRLLPFTGGTHVRDERVVGQSALAITAPIISRSAEQISRIFGVQEPLATRLERAGWKTDSTTFRLKQAGWAGAGLAIALLLLTALHPPLLTVPLFIIGTPLLAFLLLEQHLAHAIQNRQQALFDELPIVSEQLAMLLSAGYSVGGAMTHLSKRNSGVSGNDLRNVCERVQLGLSTSSALREWADVAAVPELHRLVATLTLSDEAGDIGRLVSDEATAIRREAQRRLIETIEKRSQQVWIPVTVATLIPGVIFLIIPFLHALQLFSAN
jgi:Flp pilus assembly protein TadB